MCIPQRLRLDAIGPNMQYQGIGEDPPGHNYTILVNSRAGIVAVLLQSTRLLNNRSAIWIPLRKRPGHRVYNDRG